MVAATEQLTLDIDGFGATDLNSFFKPGLSVQTGNSHGNSTFGTGLFACECCITNGAGMMTIATMPSMGPIAVAHRAIDKCQDTQQFYVERSEAPVYGLSVSGTAITFKDFQKPVPQKQQVENICQRLSAMYSRAILDGRLQIVIERNSEQQIVEPEQPPLCEELHTETITINGHHFEVEWGVTKEPCRDSGVRLVYGGKFFETNSNPCGDYNLGRFYAQLRIPRSSGKQMMDLMKRSVDTDMLEPVFTQCEVLFQESLKRSDALCSEDEDTVLTQQIEHLLAVATQPSKSGSGNQDRREYQGRNPEQVGVAPRHTGRKRRGRKGSVSPGFLKVDWVHKGADEPMAFYDPSGHRITFNKDNPVNMQAKENKQAMLLASIAAASIARMVEGTDKQKRFGFADDSFEEIYRQLMLRMQK